MKVTSKQHNSRMCFVCGMDNKEGLKAQFYNMEDGSVMTPFMYRPEHQSFPGRVHGGLITTMLDELAFRAIWAKNGEDDFGVTMSLETKYRKPVPYDEPLIGKGIVVKDTSKFIVIECGIYTKEKVLLADAEVKYLRLPPKMIASDADPHIEMCYLIEDDVKEISFTDGE